MPLKDRKVLITGGGRGIGRAIALAFAREGADVCVIARTSSEIDGVAGEIRSLGRQALAISGDVTIQQGVEGAVRQAIDTFGRIDVLINNAGGGFESKPVVESTPDLWIHTIEVNLIGTYLLTRAVLPQMIENGNGKIINIGSGMGHHPHGLRGGTAYAAAKAGVWMFTQALSAEVWKYGIDVNEIVPGPVETRLTENSFRIGGPAPYTESERVKSADEVAPLAVFLAAQPPGGPTGQSFSLARRPL